MKRVSHGLALRMYAAYMEPLSMRDVATRFGVGKSAVARAFRDWGLETRPVGWNARTAKPRRPKPVEKSIAVIPRWQPPRPWCGQCERRVSAAEARQCSSQWCKAKCDEASRQPTKSCQPAIATLEQQGA